MKLIFLLVTLLISAQVNGVSAFADTPTQPMPDGQFPDDWFSQPDLDPSELVSKTEAQNFVTQFFDLADKYIFDPSVFANERLAAKSALLKALEGQINFSRSTVYTNLKNAIAKVPLSHFYLFDPPTARWLINRISGPPSPANRVSAVMVNTIGVLSIKSFLVPEINKADVDSALLQLTNAKAILIDLRDNGGGSSSSVSYTIQNFLGPDKTIFSIRNRAGMSKNVPYLMNNYFDDVFNAGSSKDIDLVEKQSYVEWRTPTKVLKDPRPVYLLTNSRCASSCEIFAIAMKENGAAKVIGTKTVGDVLGATSYRPLWKGYLALIPYSQVLSPNGKLYEGVGLSPDIEIPDCNDSTLKTDTCLAGALKNIKDATQLD